MHLTGHKTSFALIDLQTVVPFEECQKKQNKYRGKFNAKCNNYHTTSSFKGAKFR